MAPSPIFWASIQSAAINGISNILAQVIAAQRDDSPFVIDWVPVVQFFVLAIISTPPNFLWQEFLESTFPAYHIAPTKAAIASASANNEKELDAEAREGRLVEPRLNKTNTAIKTLLDQTVGAALNTLLFLTFTHGVRAGMAHRGPAGYADPARSLNFLLSGQAFRPEGVEWALVRAKTQREFLPILKAGWAFWPFVSLVNFVFLTSVEARNLVGSLAGLGWGIYMSLFAGN
ncbi:hypothetical protein B0H67DRAFT_475905 [Lasiosphaeris hirsuta]|uniref:PXMP2/4 family protein 3 n=1 Tax=Lasiosphaeris hirsuta TaxID=260670 RepID=A0AA40B983_9PEZI|nr:hypothetical protein B0H67DRAFT_475905 [Lasiosphaeris hirsuta]